MLFGHLAVSALLHRYLKADLTPVVAGGVFPDVVDKPQCHIFHLTPNGRRVGHTLLGLALSTLVMGVIRGRRTAWSWAAGYLGHLLCDTGNLVPWLYPIVVYDFSRSSFSLLRILRRMVTRPNPLELMLSVWAIYALSRPPSTKSR